MKVDGITLLQMIKDGKINDDTQVKYGINKYSLGYVLDLIWGRDLTNGEFYILEEDKPIEELKIDYAGDIEEKIFYEKGDMPNHCILGNAGTELLINKINELIKAVNKLNKESEE